jgi:COP9 signalosome complex subunit 1
MGKEDLGSHYFDIGDLASAKNAYTGMRDYCTTPKHILDMCLKLIIVGIEQANWMSVQSNVMKIRSLQRSPDEEALVQPILSTSMGLAHLASSSYRDAALSFVSTNPTLGARFSQVISPNDVAIYGGLCALTSMDRNDLQSKVLDNASFRNFLELEPHIRRAIAFFCNSKYSQCLETLEAYRKDYLLDIHLQRHVPELYYRVRSKSIVQYFIPFSCVTLHSMASAFVTDEESIESELVEMIQRGILDARIDTQNKVLLPAPTPLLNSPANPPANIPINTAPDIHTPKQPHHNPHLRPPHGKEIRTHCPPPPHAHEHRRRRSRGPHAEGDSTAVCR